MPMELPVSLVSINSSLNPQDTYYYSILACKANTLSKFHMQYALSVSDVLSPILFASLALLMPVVYGPFGDGLDLHRYFESNPLSYYYHHHVLLLESSQSHLPDTAMSAK